MYYDTRLLPQGWDREELLGSDTEEGEDVDEVGVELWSLPVYGHVLKFCRIVKARSGNFCHCCSE